MIIQAAFLAIEKQGAPQMMKNGAHNEELIELPQEGRPLRILITNVGIANRTGTEVVVMDLARGLAAAGHEPMIWAPQIRTALVADLVAAGIPVVSRLEHLPAAPHVIHAQHHQETIEALRRFPEAPAVFVCHSAHWWHDSPPRHSRIRRWVGVDGLCRDRLARTPWVERGRISMIPNAVHLQRFSRRDALPPRPANVLIFSNNAGPGTHLEPIREACRKMGIAVDCLGSGAGNQSTEPEQALPRYDLVFAKARCALEAMAVGCAVVLADASGLGSMVTSGNVQDYRRWNFGFGLLTRQLHPESIAQEIRRYDSRDAARVSSFVRRDAALDDAVSQYVSLYRAALAEVVQNGLAGQRKINGFEAAPGSLCAVNERLDGSASPDGYPETRRLEREDQAGLRLAFRQFPGEVGAQREFSVTVAVANRAATYVATAAPWPSFLVYRWIHRETGEALAAPHLRSIIDPPAAPHSTTEYRMRVAAPAQTGVHILRVTMIQEGWRWLDAVEPVVCAEALVPVSSGEF